MAIKVVSVSPTGRIRKTTASKPSTHSRINQLLSALGIDKQSYQQSASIRMYSRMASHQYLGINS